MRTEDLVKTQLEESWVRIQELEKSNKLLMIEQGIGDIK